MNSITYIITKDPLKLLCERANNKIPDPEKLRKQLHQITLKIKEIEIQLGERRVFNRDGVELIGNDYQAWKQENLNNLAFLRNRHSEIVITLKQIGAWKYRNRYNS